MTRRLVRSALLALLMFPLLAATSSAYHPGHVLPTGKVEGTVTDGTTGEPLPDVCAVVRGLFGGIPGGSARSDATGRYAVTGLSMSGSYDISFSDCADPTRGYGPYKHPEGISFPPFATSPMTHTRDAKLYLAEGGQPDGDGDGIADGVDTQPATTSALFADASGTTGAVLHPGGLTLTVTDLEQPGGVRVAAGGGTGSATLQTCGFFVQVPAGTTADLTCGSIRVAVISGAPVTVDLGDSVVTIPVGSTARVTEDGQDGTAGVESITGPPVTVSVGGVVLSVAPGEATTVVSALNGESLCGLTRRLAGDAHVPGTGPVDAACRSFELAASEAPGAHLTALGRQLGALVAQGRLSAQDGDRLRSFAAAL